jgi:DNA-directed RNA polymerase II subunit RPB2
VDTPDGANCGLHKNMTLMCHITTGFSGQPMIKWMRDIIGMKLLEECPRKYLFSATKIFVNGAWVGVISNPDEVNLQIRAYRRFGLISPFISSHWEIQNNEMYIYTDGGRLCRPLLYYNNITSSFSFEKKEILQAIKTDEFNWKSLVIGMNKMAVEDYVMDSPIIYTPRMLYDVETIVEVQKKNHC